MNVYVETNFLLELVLEQEESDSCERLIELAEAKRIRLVIPAFSLAESHIALMRKQSERNKLMAQLRDSFRDIGRSKSFRSSFETLLGITSVVVDSTGRERTRLQDRTQELLTVAEVIPLDDKLVWNALGFQVALDWSFQDAVVLASVQYHIEETKPERSCFLNRNSKDFDDPDLRDRLGEMGSRFFARFDRGLGFIQSHSRGE